MKEKDLPASIICPLTREVAYLGYLKPNDEFLDAMQDTGNSVEYYDGHLAEYKTSAGVVTYIKFEE